MTVRELIEELSKKDQDKLVVKGGYEGGLVEVAGPADIKMNMNVNRDWYYGPHEEEDDGDTDAVKI